jgi:hypothetical protein
LACHILLTSVRTSGGFRHFSYCTSYFSPLLTLSYLLICWCDKHNATFSKDSTELTQVRPSRKATLRPTISCEAILRDSTLPVVAADSQGQPQLPMSIQEHTYPPGNQPRGRRQGQANRRTLFGDGTRALKRLLLLTDEERENSSNSIVWAVCQLSREVIPSCYLRKVKVSMKISSLAVPPDFDVAQDSG